MSLYLDLLKQEITGILHEDRGMHFDGTVKPYNEWIRARGGDWPLTACTMIGMDRLRNLEEAINTVLREDVPGDFCETGVWRGGASIFMAAALAELAVDTKRNVWVCDSFAGCPVPDPGTYPEDAEMFLNVQTFLAVPLEEVKANFKRYGLLGDNVRFLPGWFRDTLPTAPIEQLAILRLDGDLYESTWVALEALYPKLSSGGYVIVDDYQIPACKSAIHRYRDAHNITAPLLDIDWTSVYWRKS